MQSPYKKTLVLDLHRKNLDATHIMESGNWARLNIVLKYTGLVKFEALSQARQIQPSIAFGNSDKIWSTLLIILDNLCR
mgnify:CR=1 FL=1